MRKLVSTLLVSSFLSLLSAQDMSKKDWTLWFTSAAFEAAGTSYDAWTSYQAVDVNHVACEANPIITGHLTLPEAWAFMIAGAAS